MKIELIWGGTRARWVITAALLGLVLFGPGVFHLVRLSLMERKLNLRLAELETEHKQLAREEERLQSDPTYIEGMIRTTFKLAQPGEYVIPLGSSQSSRRPY